MKFNKANLHRLDNDISNNILESAVQMIPIVGGPIATLVFGSLRDIQARRLEDFLHQISAEINQVKIQFVDFSLHDEDKLAALLEDLFEKVSKEPLKEKLHFFKLYFFNMLLTPTDTNYDERRYFLQCLENMNLMDCRAVLHLNEFKEPVSSYDLNIDGISQYKLTGSLNRLKHYGFVTTSSKGMTFGTTNKELDGDVEVNSYGKDFIDFCLTESKKASAT
ncbi:MULTISPECIES: hypothetical protein [Exiguobacterium]|uniref:hypothetical protein n=1 Tax=Exiguobacterium TaxID=33986 RepID=UPI00047B8D01|nr:MULTISPECIES: hypothetical protein [Exiguobacterium]